MVLFPFISLVISQQSVEKECLSIETGGPRLSQKFRGSSRIHLPSYKSLRIPSSVFRLRWICNSKGASGHFCTLTPKMTTWEIWGRGSEVAALWVENSSPNLDVRVPRSLSVQRLTLSSQADLGALYNKGRSPNTELSSNQAALLSSISHQIHQAGQQPPAGDTSENCSGA